MEAVSIGLFPHLTFVTSTLIYFKENASSTYYKLLTMTMHYATIKNSFCIINSRLQAFKDVNLFLFSFCYQRNRE